MVGIVLIISRQFIPFSGQNGFGELIVECNIDSVNIFLNKKLKGSTSSINVLKIDSLKPGIYILRAKKKNFDSIVVKNIKINSGEITTEMINLSSLRKNKPLVNQKRSSLKGTNDSLSQNLTQAINNVREAKKYYKVKLVLPSSMKGANIFVDTKPANIISQTLTLAIIRVEAKEGIRQISIRKGISGCTKQLIINKDDLRIQPCQ